MFYAERSSGPTRARSVRGSSRWSYPCGSDERNQTDQPSRMLLGCHLLYSAKRMAPLIRKPPRRQTVELRVDRSLDIKTEALVQAAPDADPARW